MLALFRALGLTAKHTFVEAQLSHPINYRSRLDLHSWLQRLAYVAGGYEPETVEFLLRLSITSHNGYFLDIGANVGLISIPFALLTPETEVVAVEAVADNFHALVENIKLNDLSRRILAVNVALGDQPKSVVIQVEGNLGKGGGTGTANILPEGSDYACERIPLDLTTLDELFASRRIDAGCSVIKIDTDGYDLKVLEGARRFLTENRPVIFGEFDAICMAWHGQSLHDVQSFAGSIGYEVWSRIDSTMKFVPSVERNGHTQDLLLLPSEKVTRYLWCRGGNNPNEVHSNLC